MKTLGFQYSCKKVFEMNVAIIVPPQDFRDETVSRAVNLLEKWGVNAIVASSTTGQCTGYHGAKFKSNILLKDVTTENFDGIILPDGPGIESYKTYDDRHLLDILKHFNSRERPIACVGNALKVLARANIISNIKVARPTDKETARLVDLFRGVITDSDFEANGNIITLSSNDHMESIIDAILDRLNIR